MGKKSPATDAPAKKRSKGKWVALIALLLVLVAVPVLASMADD